MGDGLTNWYHEAEHTVGEIAAAVQEHRSISLEPLETLARDAVSSLQRNDELVVQALAGPSGSPLITNLINVAILGTKVGIGLGYYGEELHQLALAGFVHDIGLFAVPKSLITKAGRLTQEERGLIERHPELGYQVVEKCGPAYHWLAQLTRQTHERFNGQGYPNRLAGREVSEMARIVGVVDVFDALVSDRPYRSRLFPHEAVKELLVVERRTFPREILKALVEQFSVYPLGTTVRLTTGEVGTVAKVNSCYPLRPVVRMDDQQEYEGSGSCEVDLSRMPLVSIAEILHPPVVGRITFSEAPPKPEISVAPTAVSDSFTSLLESLDAVALTLQGVVDTKRTSLKPPDVGTNH
ncbi:MAG TPA: HD domain-containing phosphohydrolase [Nitrospira sp.]|nr:HD domain-containing phosphohydrolase [Nitrospira sp.]